MKHLKVKGSVIAALFAMLLPAMGATTAAEAASETVVVNTSPAFATTYWSEEKMRAAKPRTPSRKGFSAASYGSSVLDFTRSRINPRSANLVAPHRAVGKLFFTVPGQGNFVCSASVIARRLVLTAAHCLYTNGIGFHTNWVFIPAYDGTKPVPSDRPLGLWNWASGEIPVQWITSGGALPNDNDFAILVMADQSFGGPLVPISTKTGKFTTAVGHLFDTMVSMLGYPCNLDSCLIMQRNDSGDHRSPPGLPSSNAYEYGSDMTGGSSGGPWVENLGTGAAPTGGFATRNAVVGVTSYVYNDPNVLVLGASQLNANFTAIRTNRCNAAPGNC
jgi:V8-like Glu-specific endopeptidase